MENGLTHPLVSVGMDVYQFLVNGDGNLLKLKPIDDDFQTHNLPLVFENVPNAPAEISSIYAGSYHMIAVDKIRQCWALGDNSKGEIGFDPEVTKKLRNPIKIESIDLPIHRAQCGDNYTICIDFEGTVWSLGNMWFYPQETGGYSSFVPVKIPSGDTSVAVDVACEMEEILVLTNEGTLQIPQPSPPPPPSSDSRRKTEDSWILTKVPGIDSIVSISSGHTHTLALSKTGRMWLFNSDIEEPPNDDGSITVLRRDDDEGRFRHFQEINLENIPFRMKSIKCFPYNQVLCVDYENNLRVLKYTYFNAISQNPNDRKSILSVSDVDLSSLFSPPNQLKRISSGLGDIQNEHIGIDEQGLCWRFSINENKKRQLFTPYGKAIQIDLHPERYNSMKGNRQQKSLKNHHRRGI